jgi:hypothetical protein
MPGGCTVGTVQTGRGTTARQLPRLCIH